MFAIRRYIQQDAEPSLPGAGARAFSPRQLATIITERRVCVCVCVNFAQCHDCSKRTNGRTNASNFPPTRAYLCRVGNDAFTTPVRRSEGRRHSEEIRWG